MYYSREAVDAVGLIGADSTDPYRARLFCVDKIPVRVLGRANQVIK